MHKKVQLWGIKLQRAAELDFIPVYKQDKAKFMLLLLKHMQQVIIRARGSPAEGRQDVQVRVWWQGSEKVTLP